MTQGNSALDPEEADVFNVGLSWSPSSGALDGLTVNLDYYNYEYSNLISREGHQDLINRDNASRCPDGVNNDPAAGPLCGTSDQNGDGIAEVYSIGPGTPDKVIRAGDGSLLRTIASYFNAPSLETSGIDLSAGYRFSAGNIGEFNTMLNLSYTLAYDIVTDTGAEIDGVGSRNAGNSIGRPLPEYKANWMFGWSRDRHSASIVVKHIDGYTDDVPQSGLRGSSSVSHQRSIASPRSTCSTTSSCLMFSSTVMVLKSPSVQRTPVTRRHHWLTWTGHLTHIPIPVVVSSTCDTEWRCKSTLVVKTRLRPGFFASILCTSRIPPDLDRLQSLLRIGERRQV